VRNFGTIWPIGLEFGPEREQALFGVRRWREMATRAGFWCDPCGSLSLVYRDEAWAVLREFAEANSAPGLSLVSPEEVERRYPLANPEGLRGALFSEHELCVRSRDALAAIVRYLGTVGVEFHFGVCAVKVHEGAVEVADERFFAYDRLVIAAGEDMRTLFPEELTAARLHRCQLQMMRTTPLAARLGTIMVSDLTLNHYPAFKHCPSLPKLREALSATMSDFEDCGVHVIAAQHGDGTLTLGDSHEYAADFEPDYYTHVEELILQNLASFVRVPDLRIASRWQGVYLKSKLGQLQVVLNPRDRVTMVTAMGGLGMTLSWGLAEKTVASWKSAANLVSVAR
jgi:FAD dependent oxidoreductase TIGR03364